MIEYLPKISVIIPIYNAENYLHVSLNSVLQQTYTNYEVILINDGSIDRSQAICMEYVNKDFRFSLFNQKNLGPSEARNAGISLSNGEYITFIDSDDWVENDWLETYVNALQQIHADLLVQGVTVETGYNTYRECVEDSFHERNTLFDAFQCLAKHGLEGFACNKMYKASLIKQYNIRFCFMLHEDKLFNTEYLCCVNSLQILSKACYHYVQHPGSLVTRRYRFDKMMLLNTSLRDARLRVAEVFDREEYKDKAWAGYIEMYTILLFSLYDKERGVTERNKRLAIWQDYQQERRRYRNVRLTYPTLSKSCFSRMAMLPPVLLDFLLKSLFTVKEKKWL